MANKGGFSWRRLTGVSKAKLNISRKTGIPLTKSGRQRKVGKAMGGCCIYIAVILILIILGIMVFI
ncbi:hypothetical protein RBH29_07020 [Herbivorax sp. ANBcel31]|uniref:hypothetical protein n=1 Tax=Herbivorax sp. ANBcel31 TaxID=3069754 RepID=UPI0027AF2574|nr:hypothetical protein [Herbivorax sp. ANBcel31]MDQ2086181.1 hypothetical protein [Herbivorax sp. ANBcel31]